MQQFTRDDSGHSFKNVRRTSRARQRTEHMARTAALNRRSERSAPLLAPSISSCSSARMRCSIAVASSLLSPGGCRCRWMVPSLSGCELLLVLTSKAASGAAEEDSAGATVAAGWSAEGSKDAGSDDISCVPARCPESDATDGCDWSASC